MHTTARDDDLFACVYDALMTNDVCQKQQLTHQLYRDWHLGKFKLAGSPSPVTRIIEAGRPIKPELVSPRDLKKRSISTVQGRVILLHAIAHIEFNAINLALDAVYRFRDLPDKFYADWLKVAKEEAEHFKLLNDYLNRHNCHYGDFPAHNGLWEMAVTTDYDPLVRMALVPRVMEARGLDVTPGMIDRLTAVGDQRAVTILQTIMHDEIGHVAIGNYWYHYFCTQRNLDPLATFCDLVDKHARTVVRGPIAVAERRLAGFSEEELDWLDQVVNERR